MVPETNATDLKQLEPEKNHIIALYFERITSIFKNLLVRHWKTYKKPYKSSHFAIEILDRDIINKMIFQKNPLLLGFRWKMYLFKFP